MDVEEALEFIDHLVFTVSEKHLDSLQKEIFRGAWNHQKYKEIAQRSHRSEKYVKGVGCELWKLLSEILGEPMSKSSLRSTLERIKNFNYSTNFARDYVGIGNVNMVCAETLNFLESPTNKDARTKSDNKSIVYEYLDEMPESGIFYGRIQELDNLEHLIVAEHYNLVLISGIVGIGKTALSIQLVERIKYEFDYVIWLNIRTSLSLETIQEKLVEFIYSQEANKFLVDKSQKDIMYYLQKYRCLVVLDNVQTIFINGQLAGNTKAECDGYNILFRQIAELSHNSCVVLLSWDKPREIVTLESEDKSVYCLQLQGLEKESQEIIKSLDLIEDEGLLELINNYQGNPLWLKIITTTIKELFNGKISELLKYDPLFLSEELNYLLSQQFNRLSDIEKQIMYVIASEPNSISMSKLLERTQLLPSNLLNAVQSLGRRSLIEKSSGEFISFGLQPIVKQYVKNQYTHTLK